MVTADNGRLLWDEKERVWINTETGDKQKHMMENMTKQEKDYWFSEKHQISVKIPEYITIKNIIDNKVDKYVAIDRCLISEICMLWEHNIHTTGCCCGHGYEAAEIYVDDNSIKAMEELGYEHKPCSLYPDRKDLFYAKSKHKE